MPLAGRGPAWPRLPQPAPHTLERWGEPLPTGSQSPEQGLARRAGPSAVGDAPGVSASPVAEREPQGLGRGPAALAFGRVPWPRLPASVSTSAG